MGKLSVIIPSRDERFLTPTIDDDFHWTAGPPPRVHGRTGFIYLVTNLVNGKEYVGQTINTIARRWNGHVSNTNIHHQPIAAAIRAHGAGNFKIEVLCRVDSNDLSGNLDALERMLIRERGTLVPNGYNLHFGGRGGPLSESHKQKLRLAHLGKKASPETRAKMSAIRKGKKLSPEHVAAIRRIDHSRIAHRRGFTISEKQRAQVSAVHKGKVLSDETKAKIRAKPTGLKQSPETIAKRIAAIAVTRERKKLAQVDNGHP